MKLAKARFAPLGVGNLLRNGAARSLRRSMSEQVEVHQPFWQRFDRQCRSTTHGWPPSTHGSESVPLGERHRGASSTLPASFSQLGPRHSRSVSFESFRTNKHCSFQFSQHGDCAAPQNSRCLNPVDSMHIQRPFWPFWFVDQLEVHPHAPPVGAQLHPPGVSTRVHWWQQSLK